MFFIFSWLPLLFFVPLKEDKSQFAKLQKTTWDFWQKNDEKGRKEAEEGDGGQWEIKE